ncbi:hypothetical protein O9929_02545 [Vibrio lentus]|nr:hypothetical protein [Vibrio lentus]
MPAPEVHPGCAKNGNHTASHVFVSVVTCAFTAAQRYLSYARQIVARSTRSERNTPVARHKQVLPMMVASLQVNAVPW